MGNVVKWRTPDEVTDANQRHSGSGHKLLHMPETLLRKPRTVHNLEVIDGKYVAINDIRTGKHTLAFKDTKSQITRERVMDLVETAKRHGRVANLICSDLEGLDLTGIVFGQALFRYASVNSTKFDIAGIHEADLTGVIFRRQ